MKIIMKKLLSNYKSTIILLVSIIIGAIVGFIFKEKATVLNQKISYFKIEDEDYISITNS